jgi:peptidyl-prolyl cis-trans isomerase B (cyclophilin B)
VLGSNVTPDEEHDLASPSLVRPRLLTLLVSLGAAISAGVATATAGGAPDPASIPALDAVVVVSDFGAFRIRFDREAAPNHVAALLSLAAQGFYDGLAFHRTIPGYLIQTGDPNTRDEDLHNDGRTGAPFRIAPEANPRTHAAGTVSMAWIGEDAGSASSHWFVTVADAPKLDGHATVVGEVVEGLDVAEQISQVSTFRNRSPMRKVTIERVELVPRDQPWSMPPSK